MPIKNFELLSIEAKRFTKLGEKPKNIRIDHNSIVTLISPLDDQDAAIDFRFTANYIGVGVIKIEGRIIYQGDPVGLSTKWSETGQMPNNVASEVHNVVMSNCIPEAMFLARDIRLPPPVPLPKVNIQAGKKGKEKPEGYA